MVAMTMMNKSYRKVAAYLEGNTRRNHAINVDYSKLFLIFVIFLLIILFL